MEKLNLFEKLRNNPKRIFQFDAIGALITSLLLLALIPFQKYIGMPKSVIYILCGCAFCLFIYALICHFFISSKWKFFLFLLMIGNSIYCLTSLGLIIKHVEKITLLGRIYFMLEVIIIGIIITLEYQLYSYNKRH